MDKILAHKINVFINRQLIYNYPEQLFADAGVMAIEHADFEGIERLALVLGTFFALCSVYRGSIKHFLTEMVVFVVWRTFYYGIISNVMFAGGEIVSTFDSPEQVKLGSCHLIEEVMVGEDRLLRFSGVPIGT